MSSSTGQRSDGIPHEYSDHVHVLNRLLKTLRDSDIPGPQLFRIDKEFKQLLGHGSEGNVRGIDQDCAKDYHRRAGDKVLKRWPLDAVAIKRHQRTHSVGQSGSRNSKDDLANRFHAAEREVLTLIPDLFRGNPHIVQLKGWGLCLDTIEDPRSGCCDSLQMPLLVLERAYKNLYEFLQEDLFPPKQTSGNVSDPEPRLVEEGRASGLGQGNTSSTTPGRDIGRLRGYLEAAARWTGFGPDPYEVIRSLCVDIGRGLESLHRANFTHGDLKPQNVLIFKAGPRWTAKLCDFGCAQGQTQLADQDSDAPSYSYRGTKAWHPPTKEISGRLSQHDLQRCDLYVYGLLVWSTFFLQCEPPARPSQAEATEATMDLLGGNSNWGPGKHHQLAVSINKVFESTLCAASNRASRPWEPLDRRDPGRESGDNEDSPPIRGQRGSSSPRKQQRVRTTKNLQPPLTNELKAAYTARGWWQPGESTAGGNPTEPGSDAAVGRRVDEFVPASSSTSQVDDIHYSMEPFLNKHHNDIGPLVNEMTRVTLLPQNLQPSIDLYCCARFRSRVPLEWWQTHNQAGINFLDKSLRCIPAVDICTLAWLCKGSVGTAEVQTLPPDYHTWRTILHPTILNESERLDRLLLLLECGARLEQTVEQPAVRGSKSILVLYLRSCRRATLPFIIREIGRRWDALKGSGQLAPTTKTYRSGRDTTQVSGEVFGLARRPTSTRHVEILEGVAQELSSFFDPKIADLWKRYMSGDGSYPAGDDLETDAAVQSPQANDQEEPPSETTGLLPPRVKFALPHGWKKHYRDRKPRKNGNFYFEDEATGSITLTKPTVSFIKLRQVKIGFLDDTQGPAANLDLSQYTASRLAMADPQALDQDAQTRFPLYDDDWFAIERETTHPSEDVLASIRDIKSFAERIVIPSALSSAAQNIWHFLVMLFGLLLLVGMAAGGVGLVILAILAAWAAFPLLVAAALWGMVCLLFLYCSVCFGRECFEEWYVLGAWVSAPLAGALFYFVMQEPCPDGPLGTMPGGEACHRCWWVIWSWFRCRVG